MTTQELDREIAELQAKITALRRQRYSGDRETRRKQREQAPRTQAIRKYYLANHSSVAEIARAFNTSSGAIQALVRKYDWPRRSPPKVAGQHRRRKGEAGNSASREVKAAAPAPHPNSKEAA